MRAEYFAQYLKDREGIEIYLHPHGFATFTYLSSEQVYIRDIFVGPDFRKKGVASQMADAIGEIARKRGMKEMLGSVDATYQFADESIRVLQAYGMKFFGIEGRLLYFKKSL